MCAFSRSKDFFLVVISLTRATQILVRTCHTTKCYKHNDRNKKTQQQNKFQTRMSQWPATPAAIIQMVTSDKSWHVTVLSTEQLLQKTKGWNRRMVAKHEYSKRFPWNQLKRSQKHKTKRENEPGLLVNSTSILTSKICLWQRTIIRIVKEGRGWLCPTTHCLVILPDSSDSVSGVSRYCYLVSDTHGGAFQVWHPWQRVYNSFFGGDTTHSYHWLALGGETLPAQVNTIRWQRAHTLTLYIHIYI